MTCQCNTCKFRRKEITKEECVRVLKEQIKSFEAENDIQNLEEANEILGEIEEDKV